MNIIMKKLFALLLILLPLWGHAGDLTQKLWYDYTSLSLEYGENGPFPSYPDGRSNRNVSKSELDNINAQLYTFWDIEGEQPDGAKTKNWVNATVDGNGYNEDCVVLQSSGLWHDYSCSGSSRRYACFDGYDWKVSSGTGNVGSNNDSSEGTGGGDAACAALTSANGQVGNYRFAAPNSWRETQRLKAIASDIWINVNDKLVESIWSVNKGLDLVAPFWNTNEPNNVGNEDCAVAYEANGLWNDSDCGGTLRYICYSPIRATADQWKITGSTGTSSNIESAHNACQTAFGSDYKFFAPRTLSEKDIVKNLTDPLNANAWVNGSDVDTEGVWRLNASVRYWATGGPDVAGNCAQANSSDGLWRAASCDQSARVVCSSGAQWKVTAVSVNLSDYSSAQMACYDEFGAGINYLLPRSLDQAEQLKAMLAAELPANTSVWVNANRILDGATWEWNSSNTQVPNWASSQPDGGKNENCTAMINSGAGEWQDLDCKDVAKDIPYVCYNSAGSSWVLSTATGNLTSLTNGHSACSAQGFEFRAPINFNENFALKAAIGATPEAWLNATDSLQEDTWVLNISRITSVPFWSGSEPDNGGIHFSAEDAGTKGEDCIYQDEDGGLHDVSCLSATNRSWACTNGPEWKVTTSQTGAISQFADGHARCFAEFGEGWLFASPANIEEAMLLDQAMDLADSKLSSTAINTVWLNMTDGAYEDEGRDGGLGLHFRSNLPYTHWLNDYPGENPATDCAFKTTSSYGDASPWRINNCTTKAAHYACYNGANWEVATAQGDLVGGTLQLVPQVGVDYWSYERGNDLCKLQFGPSYFFSAPVLAEEEAALDNAIRALGAQVKNTWINYYQVKRIAARHNDWFANRTSAGAWSGMVTSNFNNQDCTLSSSAGAWTDESCEDSSLTYAYACFNGSWKILGSSEKGQWEKGFAVCDNEAGNDHIFAVPRSPQEKAELTTAIASSGESYVWVNYSDTSVESQWISNRLRYAWWSDGEPSTDGNRDCATTNETGNWFAERCEFSVARFACRDGGVWKISDQKGVWAQGFAICGKEYPGSEFDVPLHQGQLTATTENDALMGAITNAGSAVPPIALVLNEMIWLNYSDRDVENSWRKSTVYADWAMETLLEENNDCAYMDRLTADNGTWQAESCKYTSTSKSRGYACTNGFEWRVVSEAPTTDHKWSGGFTACNTLDSGSDDWSFSAPTTAYENSKLKLAMELKLVGGSGVGQVWLNAHDRIIEGEWLINGKETNFPATINLSATATSVNENTTGIILTADLDDDEAVGIQSATWELIDDSRLGGLAAAPSVLSTLSATTLTPGAPGQAQATATYNTPSLLQEDFFLTFKITVTDLPSGTAPSVTNEATVQVKVESPMLAWYDFNDLAAPQKDISNNNHDAINTQAESLPPVSAGALQMDGTTTMRVPGIASDATNGLVLPMAEYTVVFRMRLEQSSAGAWRGILQKGDGGNDRQPGLFLNSTSEQLHFSNTTTTVASNGSLSANPIETNQWVNIAYVKYADKLEYVVDGVVVDTLNFGAGESSVNNTGDLRIGKIPGAPAGFVGAIDDIQIFNRTLSVAELAAALPAPPGGEINFTTTTFTANEDASSVNLVFERSEGTVGAVSIYYRRDDANTSVGAVEGAVNIAGPEATDPDYDLPAAYTLANGQQLSWADGVKGQQSITIALDNADDTHREGSERIVFDLVNATGVNIGQVDTASLYLIDVTPNPYGNFKITSGWTPPVYENIGTTQQACIARDSGSTGEVTVNYEISGTAILGTNTATDNYQFLGTGDIVPAATTGSVTFADADGAQKCFDIQVYNHPTDYGESDKTVVLQITSLTHLPALEPLLTDENSVTLTILDYSPGSFELADGSAMTCYEPNYSTDVVVSQRPPTNPTECKVIVRRKDVGLAAPEAHLTVTVESGNTATNTTDFTFTGSLDWPEIKRGDVIDPSNELQEIVISIVNDDVYEDANAPTTPSVTDPETFGLKLNPTNGDGFDESVNALLQVIPVEIKDVSTPSLVTLAAAPSNTLVIDEGQSVSLQITRGPNKQTSFNVDAAFDVLGVTTDSEHINTGTTAISRTLNFVKEGVPADSVQTILLQTTNLQTDPNDRVIRLNLNNATPDYIVGLGSISNAGGGAGVNETSIDVMVNNTFDALSNVVSLNALTYNDIALSSNIGSPTAVNTVQQTVEAKPQIVKLDLDISAFKGVWELQDSTVNYTWKVKNSSGTELTTINGLAISEFFVSTGEAAKPYTGTLAFSDGTIAKKEAWYMRMPYVTSNTSLELELTVSGVTTGQSIVFSRAVQVQPYWRRIEYNNGNECMYANSNNDVSWNWGVPSCGGGDNYYWNYNWYTGQLENRNYPGRCLQGDGTVSVAVCSTSETKQNMYAVGNQFRRRDNEQYLCGAVFGNVFMYDQGDGCTYGNFRWRDL